MKILAAVTPKRLAAAVFTVGVLGGGIAPAALTVMASAAPAAAVASAPGMYYGAHPNMYYG